MDIKELILIIEDENSIATYISSILESNGFSTIISATGNDGLHMLTSHCPDLVILDLGLPDIDGTSIIENIRRWSSIPIVVVSARGRERDKVEAIELGADDYITKPFGAAELIARIRLAIRHHGFSNPENQNNCGKVFHAKDLTINFEKHEIKIRDDVIHFTQNEFKILGYLAKNSGKVVSYEHIIKEVWGPYGGNDNQILRVNMANIRRKLEKDTTQPEYIFTEVGIGYRMIEADIPL